MTACLKQGKGEAGRVETRPEGGAKAEAARAAGVGAVAVAVEPASWERAGSGAGITTTETWAVVNTEIAGRWAWRETAQGGRITRPLAGVTPQKTGIAGARQQQQQQPTRTKATAAAAAVSEL